MGNVGGKARGVFDGRDLIEVFDHQQRATERRLTEPVAVGTLPGTVQGSCPMPDEERVSEDLDLVQRMEPCRHALGDGRVDVTDGPEDAVAIGVDKTA